MIVDRLNEPPLSLKLTLVTLDEKNAIQLLQVVNDVFTHLDATHMRDLRDEPPEQCHTRMLQFLAVLNYKHGQDPYACATSAIHVHRSFCNFVLPLSVAHRVACLRGGICGGHAGR